MKMLARPVIAAVLAATTMAAVAAPKISPVIAAALADPARADQQGDDARRKAAEVLAFSGVKPGQQVVDFFPGKGYWTRIFTGIVGPQGHVYALWPALGAKYAEKAVPDLQARNLANVTTEVQAGNVLTVPVPVDLVLTVQNYHDVPQDLVKDFNASVFKALKKGGTYLVIDHADTFPKGAANVSTLHRIDPALVKNQIVSAGFVFVAASDVLRNKSDDHSLAVFDPAIRGRTDQFVLKFRKP